MAKHLLCRIGWHHWRVETNDTGERYNTCRRCGKFTDYPGPVPRL